MGLWFSVSAIGKPNKANIQEIIEKKKSKQAQITYLTVFNYHFLARTLLIIKKIGC